MFFRGTTLMCTLNVVVSVRIPSFNSLSCINGLNSRVTVHYSSVYLESNKHQDKADYENKSQQNSGVVQLHIAKNTRTHEIRAKMWPF